ncbi:unnamed protein product [Mytilus edulis]|uniref:Ig-like domain-containing protein n=1 Tax=Mytilus edulis TaxID=6550 RepID=A0A8S3VE34_MYTED|nr:unnamed protein product [Mytilus edulis]
MTHKELRIIIVTLLLVEGTCVSYMYAKEGTTVNIACPMTTPVDLLTWRGPPGLKTYFSGSQRLNVIKANSPDISISKVNLNDGTLCLTCSAVGGIPNIYTYDWEHRTDTGDLVRHFPPQPTIKIKMDLFTNNGAYICRVSNNIGTTFKNDWQISKYNLNVLAAPQFVNSNTEERYFDKNKLTEFKLQYVTNPDANYSVLTDNREISIEEFYLNSINISVTEARIQESIYDKLVYIKGCEIGGDTETQNDTEEDSHYGASTTHTRQSELQASFANDIYRDVSQLEASARVEPFIRIQKSVSTYQLSSTGQSNQRENNELNYIEVAFDQRSTQKRHKFYCDDRTPYADVDLTIKVDPLPDSDPESNSEED